jgi:hypothetical protein
LEVIQEERKGMFGSGKNAEKSAEHPLEPVIRILARKVRHGRLLADHQLQLRNQVHHELSVRIYSITDRIAPKRDLRFILAQNLADQGLESLRKSRVRDVPLVLVELA